MSTIRELLNEAREVGRSHAFIQQIEAAVGKLSVTPQVTVIDAHEVAIVFVNDEPRGLAVVDWSEPCLEFKPLAK